ncbi:hypothetical protein [Thalassoroseus pseudoceratinae]|uniref:hypothetical protein n=1 Tax=Thalassoroseus pseudoceratinae TaxID=2713176 RepID=UPI00141D82D2|nr:hypothetical protein [Thalassoroseus pseudoceratinae]
MRGIPVALTILLMLTFGNGPTATAQQRPEVGYVFPPGAAPGTTVEVKLGGYDFTPDTQFFVLDERIQLEVLGPPSEQLHPGPPHWFGPKAVNSNKPFLVPREVPARLTIPANYPPSVIHWQAANANGASEVGQFVVGNGLPERLESECNFVSNSRPRCRKISELPIVISGCLQKKEEIDCYEWTAPETGLISVVLPACPVGSPIYPVVEIQDRDGNRIADVTATTHREVSLTIPVTAEQTYRVQLHDADYRGDRSMVYRLHLRHGPHVTATVPVAGTRGQTQTVRFYGTGLQTGADKMESIERTVRFPETSESEFWHPPIKTEVGLTQPVRFELSDSPEHTETKSSTSQRRPIPSAITGQILEPYEVDEYRFQAAPEQPLSILAEAERFGSPCDLSLEIVDATGNVVATNDDLPSRTDAGLVFQPKSEDEYRVRVWDLSGTSTQRERCVYRLSITTVEHDLTLHVPIRAETVLGADPVATPKRTNPKAREKAGLMVVSIERLGGFSGNVTLTVSDLPDGVQTAESTTIPAKESAVSIPIWCDANATSFAKLATVRAIGNREDGTRVERTAKVLVAPVMKPRAVVKPKYPDGGRTVYRGATYPAPVVLERLEDYTGEIELQMAARPDRVRQGIIGGDLTVPAGVSAIDFPLFIPEWVQIDRTSRIVLNTVVQVPDPQGNVRSLVNRMVRRITMNVEGALLKIAVDEEQVHWRRLDDREDLLEVPIQIRRTPKLTGPVQIALANDSAGEFQAEPVIVTDDQTTVILRIQHVGQKTMPRDGALTIEAVGERGGLPVRSRTVFTLPQRDDD